MTEKDVATDNNQENQENNEEGGGDNKIESSIIRQVEFYFSDANLPRDKFLREQVKLDDGWVPLDVLTRFNRLAKLTTDTDVIANALNNSTSGLLEVSEDNKKVRRNPELPVPEMNEERRKELLGRTIYIKGFPKDSTLDDLLKFFKEDSEVQNIIMRRYLDKASKKRLFKGSIFVNFKTKEQAEKLVNDKDLKYNDTPLIVLWQEDYLKQKQEEYSNRKDKKDKKTKEKDAEAENKEEFSLPTGTVFRFSEGDDKMKREDVRDALVALGAEIAFIDFKVGDSEGWVRLTKENAAITLAEKITDGKIKIGENEVVFQLLEGDAEKTYLDKTVEEMVKRRKNQKSFSKHNKGKNFKNRGRQGNGRKRRQGNHDDAPPSKVKADS